MPGHGHSLGRHSSVGEADWLDSGVADDGGSAGQILSYTLNDVIALRKDLVRETQELGHADATSTTMPQLLRDQWRQMRQRVIDYLSDAPSWLRADSQYRAGAAIQQDLLPWYDKLRPYDPTLGSAPTQPASQGGQVASSLKWGVVLVAGVLAVVVISQTGLPRIFGGSKR